jgi:hypothetical protein
MFWSKRWGKIEKIDWWSAGIAICQLRLKAGQILFRSSCAVPGLLASSGTRSRRLYESIEKTVWVSSGITTRTTVKITMPGIRPDLELPKSTKGLVENAHIHMDHVQGHHSMSGEHPDHESQIRQTALSRKRMILCRVGKNRTDRRLVDQPRIESIPKIDSNRFWC